MLRCDKMQSSRKRRMILETSYESAVVSPRTGKEWIQRKTCIIWNSQKNKKDILNQFDQCALVHQAMKG